ncbi:hypothetical protein ACFQ3Z_26075 [Streptomyces nogalater]
MSDTPAAASRPGAADQAEGAMGRPHDAVPRPGPGPWCRPPGTSGCRPPWPSCRRARAAAGDRGGFDFFGTQKGTPKAALDSVQNEDLADVVGPEALAVHKAEAEAGFKPADERSRGPDHRPDGARRDRADRRTGLRSAAS